VSRAAEVGRAVWGAAVIVLMPALLVWAAVGWMDASLAALVAP
jgi:hypothetical protein